MNWVKRIKVGWIVYKGKSGMNRVERVGRIRWRGEGWDLMG